MNEQLDLPRAVEIAELQPGMAVPVETYFRWLDLQEGRYEYDRGTVAMMVRVTAGHAQLVWRFVTLITAQIDIDRFQVFSEAFGVHTTGSVRFPDVLVQVAERDGRALKSAAPVIIVEVVSPSSIFLDYVVKRDEYFGLPTLQAYLVADPDAARITSWEREDDGKFPATPTTIEGIEATLKLRTLDLSLPLNELYRGVTL